MDGGRRGRVTALLMVEPLGVAGDKEDEEGGDGRYGEFGDGKLRDEEIYGELRDEGICGELGLDGEIYGELGCDPGGDG